MLKISGCDRYCIQNCLMTRPIRSLKKLKEKGPMLNMIGPFSYYLAEAGDSPAYKAERSMLREPSLEPTGVKFSVIQYFCAKRLERHRAAFQAVPGAGLHEHFSIASSNCVSTFFTNVRIRPIRAPLINARLALRMIRFLEDLWFAIAFSRSFISMNYLRGAGYMLFLPPSSSAFAIIKHHCFFGNNTFWIDDHMKLVWL